jgi:uncharacterized membrane protein YeaQ/YmgE (transglycosylase-associated protein family)
MGIVAWIILGLIAGSIAHWMSPGEEPVGGLIGNIIVGILGAVIGGWIGSSLFGVGLSGLDLSSFLVAIVGSLIVLWIYRAFVRRV